jgi:S-adenosylmethionine hydrolase
VIAEVLWVDRFGNCQLNLDPDEVDALGPQIQLRWSDDVRTARRAPTYEGVAPGQVGLVVDSYGMLSICLGKRSAAAELGIGVGSEITLRTPADGDLEPPMSQPVTLTPRSAP